MKELMIKALVPIAMAIVLPSSTLLAWLGIAMVLDLITGVACAVKKGVPRTSKGFRGTITKFLQYGGAIAIGIVLANLFEIQKETATEAIFKYYNSGLISFIIFIEIKSILENLIEISPDSDFTKYFLTIVHDFISLNFIQKFKQPEQ
jgi:hypothetical protein